MRPAEGDGGGDLRNARPEGVELLVTSDEGSAAAAAAVFVREAQAAALARGLFTVALSGGSTPNALYRLLSGPAGRAVPWSRTHLLWSDERCVPPTHDASNYAAAARCGLLDLPLGGVHRMQGELDPERAAAAYAELLERVGRPPGVGAPSEVSDGAESREAGSAETGPHEPPLPPSLDLVLLGLGADGHTASLFPGSPALLESRWVAATPPHAGLRRLTLTPPVLAAARRLLFLVTGAEKAGAVDRVLRLRDPEAPAASVLGNARAATWVMDESAAAVLQAS